MLSAPLYCKKNSIIYRQTTTTTTTITTTSSTTTTTTKKNKILNMYMTPYALSDLKSLLQAAQNSSGGTSESLEPRPSASVAM